MTFRNRSLSVFNPGLKYIHNYKLLSIYLKSFLFIRIILTDLKVFKHEYINLSDIEEEKNCINQSF